MTIQYIDGKMHLTQKCPFCEKQTTMVQEMTYDQYVRIMLRDELIQSIIPKANVVFREFVILAICAKCQETY